MLKKNTYTDVRDGFFDSVYILAKKNKNVIFLTSDHTAFSLKKFEEDLPSQYLNLGISEQSIMGVAAGLAQKNKIVFVYGIAPFMSLRCLEQINIDICSMKSNVNIISMGSGLTYSNDGPTHHGTQDQAILSNLPNLNIFNVSDFKTSSSLPKIVKKNNFPKFFRIEKGRLNNLYTNDSFFLKEGFGYFRKSKKNLIISTGIMTQTAFQVKEELKKHNIQISIVDVIRVKPFNQKSISKIIKKYKNIFTLEENMPYGGLGSIISEIIATQYDKKNFLKISLPDKYLFDSGSRIWMHKKNKLDYKSISRKILKHIK